MGERPRKSPDAPTPSGVRTAKQPEKPSVDHLFVKKEDMWNLYVQDTLASMEAGDEIPTQLRAELLNALRRLDIVEEDIPWKGASLPRVRVYNHTINTGVEIRAQKLLDLLKQGFNPGPVMRQRLMKALENM